MALWHHYLLQADILLTIIRQQDVRTRFISRYGACLCQKKKN